MTHSSSLLKFLLPLSSFLFPLAFALPFQEPIPGVYECFVAGDDPFSANVQNAGARLEIKPNATYTFTTASATESGAFQILSLENDTQMTQLFRSGVELSLTPQSGSSAYYGSFVIDKQGSLYVLIQNTGGVWIRCQSEGADIATALKLAFQDISETNAVQSGAEASGQVPKLTPMNAVAQGTYQCYYSFDDYDTDTGAHIPDPFEESFTLELFANNQYVCTSDFGADGCDDIGEDNIFELRPDGSFTWLGGDMEIYYDDWISRYGQDNNGIPTFVMYEEDEDISTDNFVYHTFKCPRVGDTASTPPSEQGTAEYQLLPATIKAPQPPAGAGGLSGLYIDFTVNQTLVPALGPNGMMTTQLEIDPPSYFYFLPNGYVYRGVYNWSYEDLDCTRMLKDGTPLCDTYVITDSGFTFGSEGTTLPFSKDGFNIVIDGVTHYYQTPVDSLALQGVFENTDGSGGISISSTFYEFFPDGTFKVDRSSAISYTTPDYGGPQTSVAGYNEDPTSTGKYAIRGNTIEFTYADGSTEKFVFNYDITDTGQVDSVWINGTVYWK